jgi:4-hydroxy-3-methylbut-2-enyl diphosphate reductase
VSTIGVSSGASVPDVLVQDVLSWLAARDFDDVEEVTHTDERLTFALPRELRRDLGDAAPVRSTRRARSETGA